MLQLGVAYCDLERQGPFTTRKTYTFACSQAGLCNNREAVKIRWEHVDSRLMDHEADNPSAVARSLVVAVWYGEGGRHGAWKVPTNQLLCREGASESTVDLAADHPTLGQFVST